jgi:hypothetical protein
MVSAPTATARDAWLSLENIFQGNQMARALNLTDELHAERQGDLSIVAYCARLKALSDQLCDIRHPLSTQALLLVLLRNLHPRHKMTAKMIQRDSAKLSYADAQNMLMMDEQQEKPSNTSTALYSAKVPAPSGGAPQPSIHGGQGSYDSPGSPSL